MPVILMNAIIRYVASTFRNKIPFNSIRAFLEMKISSQQMKEQRGLQTYRKFTIANFNVNKIWLKNKVILHHFK
jgi:hypothetical protein